MRPPQHAVCDPRSGQPIAGLFMGYAMPRADDLPFIRPRLNSTCCTTNPLGVKGCGEAGAIAAFPATPQRIRKAIGS
jgi:carbon-monoxide dehydrogenase large subunit